VPSDPGGRICLSIGGLVSLAARRVWTTARVAEREPRRPDHAEFVICEQSIERTIAWIDQQRRMSKDYEKLCASGEAFVYAAMIRLMTRRLVRI
jgi:transposase